MVTIILDSISFDSAKRDKTLAERGVDFADAVFVFQQSALDVPDRRFDYGEERILSVGLLNQRMMIVVWTPRGEKRHIISMRKANEREKRRYLPYFRK